jgi:Putative zinc-finger
MNECVSAEIRDALPDLIHGSLDAARAADVEAHVASCAECVAELDLLRVVVASATKAPAMDVGRIAAALPTPTRRGLLLHQGGRQPAGSRKLQTVWSRPLLRAAATVAIVTAGGLSLVVGRDVLNPERQVGRPATRVAAAAPSVAPQQAVARHLASAAGLSLVSEVQDLSDEHLATLLSEMDSMDAIPGVEPEPITPVIEVSDNRGMIQ